MQLDVVQPDERGTGTGGDPWYAGGLKFTCSQCGNCCTGPPGFVWISREEIVRLGEFLRLSPQEVVERYCRKVNGKFSLKEHRNARGEYDCVFLTEEPAPAPTSQGRQTVTLTRRGCSVYPVRPLQCRTWPFWDSNLLSTEAWAHAARRCHGMGHGRRTFTREQIEALRDAEDWPENPPTSAPKGNER